MFTDSVDFLSITWNISQLCYQAAHWLWRSNVERNNLSKAQVLILVVRLASAFPIFSLLLTSCLLISVLLVRLRQKHVHKAKRILARQSSEILFRLSNVNYLLQVH